MVTVLLIYLLPVRKESKLTGKTQKNKDLFDMINCDFFPHLFFAHLFWYDFIIDLKGRYTFGDYPKTNINLKTDLVTSIGELFMV